MKALILRGGQSSRMGSDKPSLSLWGETLLDRQVNLAHSITPDVFLSVAFSDKGKGHPVPAIPDLEESPGPLGGLQSAFAQDPDSSWLLIACDLPRLSQRDLIRLLDTREGTDVSCFLNPIDGVPEPLAALYHPSAAPKLEAYFQGKNRCARRFLQGLCRNEVKPLDPQALLNLNCPEHLFEFEALHREKITFKEVEVEYFAKLSAEASCDREQLRTSAATVVGLWEEVRLRHHFSLELPQIKPARDNEFIPWDTPLRDNDAISFMPPFAGG